MRIASAYFDDFANIRFFLIENGCSPAHIAGCDQESLDRIVAAFNNRISAEHMAFYEVFGVRNPLTESVDMATFPSVLALPDCFIESAVDEGSTSDDMLTWIPISTWCDQFLVYPKGARKLIRYDVREKTFTSISESMLDFYWEQARSMLAK